MFMKKSILFFAVLFSLNSAIGQPPPPGFDINHYFVIDDNNDGFTTFDISYYINTLLHNKAMAMGFNLSGYNISLFPSYTDYINNTNVIGVSYVNQTNSYQNCNLKIEYSGTGNIYNQATLEFYFSNVVLKTVDYNQDEDNDSILNELEDLNNDNILNNEDTDSDGLNNFQDSDDDNDGVLTIDEDYNSNGIYSDDDLNNNGIADYLDNTQMLSSDYFFTTNKIKLYPNPVKSYLNIENLPSDYISIEILNMNGKVLVVKNEKIKTLDFSNLESGIYIVKINCMDKSLPFKIVKI